MTYMRKAKTKKNAWIAWSKDEVKLLKKLFPDGRAREIAEQIGRSMRATRSKIFRLGLQKKLRYECPLFVNGTKEKLCGKCRKWKSESQFGKNRSSKDGIQWQGRECESKYAHKHYEEIRKSWRRNLRYEDRHRVVKGAKEKFCRKCRRWKRESDFYKDNSEKDGLTVRCKKCSYKAAGISRKK